MKFITRPITITSLEWTWKTGWTCTWERVTPDPAVPHGGTCAGFTTIRKLLRRLDWWTMPLKEFDREEYERQILRDAARTSASSVL